VDAYRVKLPSMKLKIPEFYKPTLRKLAAMTDQERQAIGTALQSASVSLKTETIGKQAQEHYRGDSSELNQLIQTLIGLNMTRINFDISIDQFAQDVVDAMQGEDGLLPQKFNRVAFLPQLTSLLKTPSIDVSSRANDVQHEYEKLFSSARILTDLRPLFGSSGTEILGMMIVHNLEISYHHNHEYKEAFFAMDESDLALLRKALDRAELKAASLQQVLKKSEIAYFDSK
jgi:hypothetical protein